jgi:hypothetical protein
MSGTLAGKIEPYLSSRVNGLLIPCLDDLVNSFKPHFGNSIVEYQESRIPHRRNRYLGLEHEDHDTLAARDGSETLSKDKFKLSRGSEVLGHDRDLLKGNLANYIEKEQEV